MIEKIDISVVMPVYNTEKSIEKSLSSILCQNIKNIEINVVDDASTDKTREIIQCLATRYPQIHLYINTENKGAGVSKNIALNKCTGKYLCFVDSDDYLEQNSLKYLFDLAEETQADDIYYEFNYALEGNNSSDKIINSRPVIREKYCNGMDFLKDRIINRRFSMSANHHFVRRSSLPKDIAFFEGSINDDYKYTIMLLCNIDKMICLENKYYTYVKRIAGSITNKANTVSMVKELFDHACEMYEYMECNNDHIRKICFSYMMCIMMNEYLKKGKISENELSYVLTELNKNDELRLLYEKARHESQYGTIYPWAISGLQNKESIYIYGAGNYGVDTFRLVRNYKIEVKGFIETQKIRDEFIGKPVYSIDEVLDLDNAIVVLALSKKNKDKVEIGLKKRNIQYISLLQGDTVKN